MKYTWPLFFLSFISVVNQVAFSQSVSPSSIKEVEVNMFTYDYSLPRESMEIGRLYPYYRFDGFTSKGQNKKWKMVEMENDYIKLWVLPAIGGKIWGAIDKKTNKEFIYYNHVVKFRDVSSRGPWTSGGIEMNFGIIGHAPWCSSQVDYVIDQHEDGSVSCTVGGEDISLGTDWRVQIILPMDKAYIETKVLWYNRTSFKRPQYQWMNAGIKTDGGLEYSFPGNKYLTHDGQSQPWPIQEGHNISMYEDNNFGHYKSYHVNGLITDFWGAYWHKDKYGMAHVSPYDDKLGKKIWIWGLSRYGMVWKDLLTDTDGQYTEVQSGKLINQSIGTSFLTPFKHCALEANQSHSWSEYWLPIGSIDGVDFCNNVLAYKIINQTKMNLYAVSPINEKLIIFSDGKEIYQNHLNLRPTQLVKLDIPVLDFQAHNIQICLGKEELFSSKVNSKELSRPEKLVANFNQNSAYGLYLQGEEFYKQRFYDKAVLFYKRSLQVDPCFSLSLNALASIYVQRNMYDEADELVKTSLSINTYDADANILFSKIAEAKKEIANQIDALSMAMLDPALTSSAAKDLAIVNFKMGKYDECKRLIEKSLRHNSLNIETLELFVILSRIRDENEEAERGIEALLKIDPLNYVSYYERYLHSKSTADLKKIKDLIVNEYKNRSYVSLASVYEKLGLDDEAVRVLEISDKDTYVSYRKAYLLHKLGKEDLAVKLLQEVDQESSSLLYPNLSVDEELFKWVISTGTSSWKGQYYLSMLLAFYGRIDEAKELLRSCKNYPDYYAFYLTRAKYLESKEQDYLTAIKLNKNNYVCYMELAKYYISEQKFDLATIILENYRKIKPDNSYINLLLAQTYSLSQKYIEAIRLLENTQVLPNEGSLSGRNNWRECNITYAISLIKAGKTSRAKKYIDNARCWPENLGVGKPYENCVDERLEDLLCWYIYKDSSLAKVYRKRIMNVALDLEKNSCMNLFTILFSEDNDLMSQMNAMMTRQNTLKWANAVYEKNFDLAKKMIMRNVHIREALPFEVLFDDRDLAIIKANYDLFETILKSINN